MKTYYILRFVEDEMILDEKLPQDRDDDEYFDIVESMEDVEELTDEARIRKGFKFDSMVEMTGEIPEDWLITGCPLVVHV